MLLKDALNAQAAGNGPHTLILVHGFGSDQTVWSSYLPWLSQHYQVITYDLPFAGSADPTFFNAARHDALAGHAEDLLDVLNSFGVNRCRLVGHSLGALIGAFAAIEQPERFDGLILIAAAPRYLDGPDFKGDSTQPDLKPCSPPPPPISGNGPRPSPRR